MSGLGYVARVTAAGFLGTFDKQRERDTHTHARARTHARTHAHTRTHTHTHTHTPTPHNTTKRVTTARTTHHPHASFFLDVHVQSYSRPPGTWSDPGYCRCVCLPVG